MVHSGTVDPVAAPELRQLLERWRRAASEAERLAAAEAIIVLVAPAVRRVVQGSAPPLAFEDIYQDTLAAICWHLGGFGGHTEGEFFGWCLRIARHKVKDHWRKVYRVDLVNLDTREVEHWIELALIELPSPDQPDHLAEARDTLKALAKLEPGCMSYLWQHHVEGWTWVEIGSAEGVAEDTIRMRVARCKERLRELLSQMR